MSVVKRAQRVPVRVEMSVVAARRSEVGTKARRSVASIQVEGLPISGLLRNVHLFRDGDCCRQAAGRELDIVSGAHPPVGVGTIHPVETNEDIGSCAQ